jgi:hypothetical protein
MARLEALITEFCARVRCAEVKLVSAVRSARLRNSATVRAALLTASVTTQDAESEPCDRPYDCHHEAQQPERPSKAPEQEVEPRFESRCDRAGSPWLGSACRLVLGLYRTVSRPKPRLGHPRTAAPVSLHASSCYGLAHQGLAGTSAHGSGMVRWRGSAIICTAVARG